MGLLCKGKIVERTSLIVPRKVARSKQGQQELMRALQKQQAGQEPLVKTGNICEKRGN